MTAAGADPEILKRGGGLVGGGFTPIYNFYKKYKKNYIGSY